MYRRILVAVDGSYICSLALQEAFKLAKETKAKLHLVHVIDISPTVEGGLNPETFRGMIREEGNNLLRKVADLAAQAGVEADTALLEAIPRKFSKAIVNEARCWDADLIVMGTHGRIGIARLVLGSVAEGVLHISRPYLCFWFGARKPRTTDLGSSLGSPAEEAVDEHSQHN